MHATPQRCPGPASASHSRQASGITHPGQNLHERPGAAWKEETEGITAAMRVHLQAGTAWDAGE